jgi:uncharacterized repeat protein (TIGR02543 family)
MIIRFRARSINNAAINPQPYLVIILLIVISVSGIGMLASSGVLQASKSLAQTKISDNSSSIFILAIETNGSGVTSPPSGVHEVINGTVIRVIANSSEGWVFDHWVVDGRTNNFSNPVSVLMDQNRTLQAVFSQIQRLVQVEIIGEGQVTVSPEQAFYPYNSIVQLTATPKDGWIFDGWDGSVADSVNTMTIQLVKDINIKAKFKQDSTKIK